MDKQESHPQPPCPICGGTDFEVGVLRSSYHPDPQGKFKGLYPFSNLLKGELIRAMKCQSCGHLDLSAGHAPESPES